VDQLEGEATAAELLRDFGVPEWLASPGYRVSNSRVAGLAVVSISKRLRGYLGWVGHGWPAWF